MLRKRVIGSMVHEEDASAWRSKRGVALATVDADDR
jgi:hypothetical protein